jgi:serine/threonine-protein kinase
LTVIARLDTARLTGTWSAGGKLAFARADEEYESALRDAEVWLPGDAPEVAAARIAASDVSVALVNALDGWADLTWDVDRRERILRVTRLADPDTGGWRSQARDPTTWADPVALVRLVKTAPVDDSRVPLILLFAARCRDKNVDPSDMMKAAHRTQPADFWLNLRLGWDAYDRKRYFEAIRFSTAAVALRPDAAISHNILGLSLIHVEGRLDEGIKHLREALRLDPAAYPVRRNLALALTNDPRADDKLHAEAIEHARFALRTEPNAAALHAMLALNLEALRKKDEALAEYRRAAECDGRNLGVQKELRAFFLRHGRAEEAMTAWKDALAFDPPEHDAWYGYAELCLYLGHEDAYRTARSKLLARFANETSPGLAERVSRACLLRPAEGVELKQAAILAERAAAADRAKYGPSLAHFQFVQGLADYRQGRFDRAIATMRGDASRVLGPAPKLVLAMGLYQKGEVAEARKTLSAAVAGHDWSAANVRDQDGWIYHSLRREAEAMIPAALPAKQ